MTDRPTDDLSDPVLAQRARFARCAVLGKRVGYALFLVAAVAFTVGATSGFSRAVTTTVTLALLGTTVTLAPAIIVAYAVRAAEREEKGLPSGH